MKQIGFDFGTTNSTIGYYNEEIKALDCFQISANSTEYIPTVVAYKNEEYSIGNIAKKNITKKGYEAYEHFKLKLGQTADEVIDGKDKSSIKVAYDYIKMLLEEYKTNQNISEIDAIVMTVPEVWFRESSNRIARENIESIYKRLGYDIETQIQLESEPVAAAGYFCWAYANSKEKNPTGSKYVGNIIVIDYGGGTLDVTLCGVENGEKIKVLERSGYGEYNSMNGCGGVAFDKAVVERICRNNNIDISKEERKFTKLCAAFEEEKITDTNRITERMKLYYNDPSIVEDEVLLTIEFNDEELPVYCKDLDECFSLVNKPVLEKSLEQIKALLKTRKVDSASQEHFKILMVGGFSNFYCVEETVRKAFGSRAGLVDKRFDQVFTINNKSLAIAKGAALIARKIVKVEHTCTHDIGFVAVRSDDDYHWIDTDICVINKGMKLAETREPIYAPNVIQPRLKSGEIRVFLDDGREDGAGRMQAALDEKVGEIFPNMDDVDNEYQIGFSVDKNLIPTLHIRDRHNKVESLSLNSLLSRISIREKA